MSTYDNGPVLDGWTVPTGRHCGDHCWGRDCPVCGFPVDAYDPTTPSRFEDHLILGEN